MKDLQLRKDFQEILDKANNDCLDNVADLEPKSKEEVLEYKSYSDALFNNLKSLFKG